MKLSLSLMLGIVAIIFLIFYLIGCLIHLWEYNIINVIFNPIAGSIIVSVPLFGLIIIMRFFNYYKTRALFYKIIKNHRRNINFTLQKDTGNDPNNEVGYTLWGSYKEFPFRFGYSLGHPLMISLVMDMRNYDIFLLNGLLKKLKMRGRQFNGYGLTIELKRPFSPKSIKRISEKLDALTDDFQRISNKLRQTV